MTTLALQPAAQGTTKLRISAYWAATTLAALAFLAGGIADLSRGPALVQGMAHLGYPAYFMLILGTWKVLGAIAVVAPGFPRLKEWAYAGMAFDLSGAALSHAAVGDPAAKVVLPLVILGLVAASSALRPAASGRILRPASGTR
ncbi:MAG TPA: DoxX family protein [Polyangiaceae bacterium]|jgi:uncharacterized membrane protein YphA (DoxX/SURF4 family)|nr:DoxX family protein [Polyangiaceae bacterium]